MKRSPFAALMSSLVNKRTVFSQQCPQPLKPREQTSFLSLTTTVMAPPPQRSQQRRASESTQHSKRKISSDHNGHSSPSEADEDEPRVAQWENDPDNDIFTAKVCSLSPLIVANYGSVQ